MNNFLKKEIETIILGFIPKEIKAIVLGFIPKTEKIEQAVSGYASSRIYF